MYGRGHRIDRAVALSLIGWYLMVPTASDVKRLGADQAASEPLTQWKTVATMGAAADCQQALDDLQTKSQEMATRDKSYQTAADALSKAKCIATDDRRLKKR
jgi:hypothetical protein